MRRRRRMLLAPAMLALCLVATACGGSSSEDAGGVATAGGGKTQGASDGKKRDPQQAGLDFARCMRERGVDVPDPSGDGGMVVIGPGPGAGGGETKTFTPSPGFEEAEKACRHHLQGMLQDGGGKIDPKEQDRALKFARCMRQHGVDMPDPDFSKGGMTVEVGGDGLDPNSETFKAAHKACGSLFGPGSGPGLAPGARS